MTHEPGPVRRKLAHLRKGFAYAEMALVCALMLSMVVVGGIGTLWGPVVGALIIGILPEVFRPLVDYRILFYTALLLLMIRFQPGGLLGEESDVTDMFSNRFVQDASR